MKRQSLMAACLATALLTASANAETPSIATAWGPMSLQLDQCLARSRGVFERLNFTRIESIRNDSYADYQTFQVGIRCVPELKMFYVFGGGPFDQDKPLIKLMDTIKQEFLR